MILLPGAGIEKCKVGCMERPERIVLVMIGAFTNRMAAILWIILVLSVVTVLARIYFTWRALKAQEASAAWLGQSLVTLPLRAVWHALYWPFDRGTWRTHLQALLSNPDLARRIGRAGRARRSSAPGTR